MPFLKLKVENKQSLRSSQAAGLGKLRIKTLNSQLSTLNSRGFTLIELLVVITIISILIAVSFFSFENARQKARDTKRKNNLEQIKAAAVLYYQDYRHFPPDPQTSSGTSFSSNTADDWIPSLKEYLDRAPRDPRQSGLNIFKNFARAFTPPAAYAQSPTTLRPTSDGRYQNPTVVINGVVDQQSPRWSAVDDDPSPDGDATRIIMRGLVSFNFDNLPSDIDTVNSLKMHFVCKINAAGVGPFLRYNGQDYKYVYSSGSPSTYTQYETRIEPGTQTTKIRKTSWPLISYEPPLEITKDVLQNAEFGLHLRNSSFIGTGSGDSADCTQVLLEVTYTSTSLPPGPSTSPSTPPAPSTPPVSSISPSTPPAPSGNCASDSFIYCYIVSADHQSFVLWAQLENKKDADIFNMPSAICKLNPPAGSLLNYCATSPK